MSLSECFGSCVKSLSLAR